MRKLALSLAGFVMLLIILFCFLRDRPRREAGSEGAMATAGSRSGTAAQGQPVRPAAETGATSAAAVAAGAPTPLSPNANPVPENPPPTNAVTVAPVNANVAKQIQALQAAKLNRTPAQQKLDSQLIYAGMMERGEPLAEGVPTLRVELDRDEKGLVLVDIDAKVNDELLARIAALGGQVVNHYAQYDAIRARLPLAQIEALAARADVKFIRSAAKMLTNVGSVTSEGDVAHRANTARTQFGVTGAGVKVGVLSDSVDHLAASQASGDLGTVTVLSGRAGTGEGEGTAMLEIVHDLAPGADLFFSTANGGPAAFAQNIRDLRFESGCDIIVDDITYTIESPFQDGVIAQAVAAVVADGALFFSSAANSGNKNDNTSGTWEGDFVDAGPLTIDGQPAGRMHSFGSTTQNSVTKAGGTTILFWADPLGHAANDYDLFVVDAAGSSLVAASTDRQNGSGDPIEGVNKVEAGQRVLIVKFSGDDRFLHLDTGRGQLAVSTAGNTRGHNAARDGYTVAAVDAKTSFPDPFTGNTKNPVETFSSDGLRRMFFNADGTAITPGNFSSTGGAVLQKPDIAAADGVVTTLPASTGLNPFYGTSAAAPHAGAVAALLKSFNRALTPAQMRSILTGTALDTESAGVDRDSGVGIVMALPALQAAPGAEQPTITSFSPASGGVGANVAITGTKFNGATSVKFNGVATPFTVGSATQISTSVPAGATTGRIIVTTPAGSATSATDFTVQLTPAITSFTPMSGAVGASVILTGANLTGATAVKFNGVTAPGFNVDSGTQIAVTVPAGATSGRIMVTTPAGTATSADVFTVTMQPSITSFAPGTGGVGTSVIINGANLTGATAVRFNGVSATPFTVDSAIRITATVPAGASTGPVSVTTPNGVATSATSFTVVPTPSITSFTPASGPVEASVTINGGNFTGTTAARFNGVASTFTVNSSGQIATTVPAGATTGTLSVTTPGGTAASVATFTVIAPPANDNFANAQVISGNSGAASGNNVAATKEAGESEHAGNEGGKSIWYRWTAPSSGIWALNTTGSTFDTLLAVYTGSSVDALTLIAANDNTAGGTNSSLAFAAGADTVYRIAVDGFRGLGGTPANASSGNVTLDWAASTAPVISSFTPASAAAGSSVTINGGNFVGATVTFNGVAASATVNSSVLITATVPAGATTGPIRITTPNGTAVSATDFTVVNPPANDQFSSAQVITGTSGSVSGRNTDASKELNEPNHAGNAGGRSIWYTWTAPSSGRWTFDTVNSSFDTLLAIYTGSGGGGLTPVASNDDAGPGTVSRAAFTATASTVYRIALDGRNGDSGSTMLNWAFTPNPPSITSFAPTSGGVGSTVVLTGVNFTGATGVRLNGVLVSAFSADSDAQITLTVPLGVNSGPISVATPNGTAVSAQPFTVTSGPANDQFAGAQVLDGHTAIVAGQNVAATKEAGEPDHAGDPGGRSVWYRWTAPSSGTWALDTAGSSFDTTLAVYTGSAVNALTPIASNDDARWDRSSRLTFAATAGTTYRITVDGFGGDNGNLVVKLLPTLPPQIIYETSFEATQGFSTSLPLTGQGGWLNDGSGGNGIVNGVFPGFGQQAYIGVTPSFVGDGSLLVWPAVNFTPQTNSRPVVRFSVLMGIVDSSNFAYDSFDWAVFNLSGQHLFSLDFDNSNLGVYYWLDDGTGFHLTDGSFENGPIYELVITMDFGRNRWSATLNGEPLITELPITTVGAPLNLGDIDAVWLPANAFFPGDNALVFDEYRITADPSEVPSILLPPQNQSVTVGSTVVFAVVASGGEPLQYEWRFNGTSLPGETNALLTLNNVSPGQSGDYSVAVSNVTGMASGSATLTVNQPGPVRLIPGAWLPDGRFQFVLTGTIGSRAAIEFSADLIQWQDLTTVVLTSGTLNLSDPEAGTQARRFYRARLQP